MSRSYRHTPIFGNSRSETEKQDKRIANRALRAAVRTRMTDAEDGAMPQLREVSNVWAWPKDGKAWMANWAKRFPASMRK